MPGDRPCLSSVSGQWLPTSVTWSYISTLLLLIVSFLHLNQAAAQLRYSNSFSRWKILVMINSLVWFSFFSSKYAKNPIKWGICAKNLVEISNFSMQNQILRNRNDYIMNTKWIHFSPPNFCLLQFFSLNFLIRWDSNANCRKIPSRLNTNIYEFKAYLWKKNLSYVCMHADIFTIFLSSVCHYLEVIPWL